MKKTLKIAGFLIIFTSIVLFSNCKKEAIEEIKIDENTFVANDIASLKKGLEALRNKTKTKLYISKMIKCEGSSGSIMLEGLSNVTIFGNKNSTTGLRRTSGYNEKNLLGLQSCSKVIVQDITFDEREGIRYKQGYPSTAWVYKSSDISFNNVTVSGSKGIMSVSVNESDNFSISNSHIEDAGAFGLWVKKSTGLLVQECTFKDCRSNALFIESVYGNNWDDNLVINNDFIHNHCDAVFNACNGPCPGGQLDIINASYLTIKENNIYDGKIETYPDLPLFSCGIELNDGNHMLIEGNTFWNNTGSDLYMNRGHTLTEVYVKNNSFEDGSQPCTRNMEQAIMIDNTCN